MLINRDILKQVHELLTERTDDLFDEEGFPTQETRELVSKIENILKKGEEVTWDDDSAKKTCHQEFAKVAADTSPHT